MWIASFRWESMTCQTRTLPDRAAEKGGLERKPPLGSPKVMEQRRPLRGSCTCMAGSCGVLEKPC